MTAPNFLIQKSVSASDQVEAHFRQMIEAKVLTPGERLPSNQALAEQFKVSGTVIHTAFTRLVRDGLIERKQKKGTFVRKFQEKANIALLFGDSIVDETAHFYRALLKRFNEACGTRKWSCRYWGGLNQEMFSSETTEPRKEQMVRDHSSHPFTGVIEYSPGLQSIIPEELRGLVPSISYGHNPHEVELFTSSYPFGAEAVRSLSALGCRKIFYFCTVWHARSYTTSIDGLLDAARQAGLPAPHVHTEPYSVQGYEMEVAMYRRMEALIANWKITGLPDGLVVNDDIAMRAIAPAILKAGIKVPQDLKVFSEGNEDVQFHYGFPVTRYETSPRAIAEYLIQSLENKINNVPVESTIKPHDRKIYHEHV